MKRYIFFSLFQFKEKWTRTSSDKLTGTFNSNASKYRTIINTARDADKVVRDKFETHKEFIELLAKGSNNMENSLPASANSVKSSPSVNQLKQLCEEVETLKAERQAIEAEIKATNPDMKSLFLNSLHNEGTINEQELSMDTLNRAFGSLIQQVLGYLSLASKVGKKKCLKNGLTWLKINFL